MNDRNALLFAALELSKAAFCILTVFSHETANSHTILTALCVLFYVRICAFDESDCPIEEKIVTGLNMTAAVSVVALKQGG